MDDGITAADVLPRFDDLVHVGAGAGGIYEDEEMTFRVFDAAPLSEGYLAMTGLRQVEPDERDERGIPYDVIRPMTVLALRAGITIVYRSPVLGPRSDGRDAGDGYVARERDRRAEAP